MADADGLAGPEQPFLLGPAPASPAGIYDCHEGSDALQASPQDDLEALRTSWQFAAAVQFCRMFKSLLRIRPFSADIFERALLDPSAHRMFLSELLCKLLRPDTSAPYSEHDCEAWEELLTSRLRVLKLSYLSGNPLADRGFFAATPLDRVQNTVSILKSGYPTTTVGHQHCMSVAVASAVCHLRLEGARVPSREGRTKDLGAFFCTYHCHPDYCLDFSISSIENDYCSRPVIP